MPMSEKMQKCKQNMKEMPKMICGKFAKQATYVYFEKYEIMQKVQKMENI